MDEEGDMKDDPKQDNARWERAERAFKRREDGAQAMSNTRPKATPYAQKRLG